MIAVMKLLACTAFRIFCSFFTAAASPDRDRDLS